MWKFKTIVLTMDYFYSYSCITNLFLVLLFWESSVRVCTYESSCQITPISSGGRFFLPACLCNWALYTCVMLPSLLLFFPDDALTYMQSWTEPLNELVVHEWADLIKTPSWQDIRGSANEMSSIGVYDTTQNDFETKLHSQFGCLVDYCTAAKILEYACQERIVQWSGCFRRLI